MQVRKRMRTFRPVKIEDLELGAVNQENAEAADKRASARQDLHCDLLGILESMPKLGNSDLRILLVLVKLSCLYGGPVPMDQGRLARTADTHRSTVAGATRRLQDIGFVDIGRDKDGLTGVYTVNHDALSRAAQVNPVMNTLLGGVLSAA